jgi:hypothetical protein
VACLLGSVASFPSSLLGLNSSNSREDYRIKPHQQLRTFLGGRTHQHHRQQVTTSLFVWLISTSL